jgi:hypothetical protein
MKTARWIFRLAAIYGLAALLPLYFLEQRIGRETPPALTHLEYFYGFIGAAGVMQLIYWLVSTDPVRFRPVIRIAVLAKLSFVVPAVLLAMYAGLSGAPLALAAVDLCLAMAFSVAYCTVKTDAAPNIEISDKGNPIGQSRVFADVRISTRICRS